LKGQSPISEEQGRASAKELDALAYVESSALCQKGLSEPIERVVQAIVDARRKEADELKELEATQTTTKKQGKQAKTSNSPATGKSGSGKEKSSSGGFFKKKK
jgi:hypothetical protein